MSNPLSFWQERNDLIDQRIRTFERKFFIVPPGIEPKEPEPPPPEGIVYSRVSSKPSLPEVFRKIEKLKMPDKGMSPDEIREQLYPTRSAK